jgi:hypothetical protein
MLVKELFAPPRHLLVTGLLLLALLFITACGTLDVGIEETDATLPPPATSLTAPQTTPTAGQGRGESFPAIAWYGTVHSVPGSTVDEADYLKPWQLAIWPKFGRAVGLAGIDPAVNAEIDRLRDQDIKATFWGDLFCNVADYGACQLLVERISPNDGGPQYEADKVEGWQGRIGRLPAQPGDQADLLYFILDGPVIALYGVASDDPTIQSELERLAGETLEPEGGGDIRIWGELNSKAQPVTGTRINVDRLELISS